MGLMPEYTLLAVDTNQFLFFSLHNIKMNLSLTYMFFISNSILGVNARVAKQIYVFKVKSSLGFA